MSRTLKAISLFTGGFGLDLGFEKSGIQTKVCVEIDHTCRSTISSVRPKIIQFSDINKVNGTQLLDAVGEKADILIGGPPCQSFSTIGNKKGTNDDRGKLIFEYFRILRETIPKYFVMENVPGLLLATYKDKPLIPWLINRFKKIGYEAQCWKLNAHEYGSPQRRIRIILVGQIAGLIAPALPRKVKRTKNIGDVIRDLSNNSGECGHFSDKVCYFLEKVPSGGNWRSLPKSDIKEAMGKADLHSGGYTGHYRRLSYDRPSPTLMTSPTQKATMLCHPEHTRPLSVAEYKRIQGFPDDWKLCGSVSHKYRQLGNAVPVHLAQAIGESIRIAYKGNYK